MDCMSIILLIPIYLVVRGAVQGWRALAVLLILTAGLIILANILGFEKTISVEASRITFRSTYIGDAAVLFAALLMLAFQAMKFRV